MTKKQVAVIGGGAVGVCTAYFLALAGHDVVVIERHHNVAEESSFAHAGLIAPGYEGPWAAPGMPKKILSNLFKSETSVLVKPGMNRPLWNWIRKWMAECELDRYRVNKIRMQRIGTYSREILQDLRERYQLDYEQTKGILQVFRTEADIAMAEPLCKILADTNIPHQMLDLEAARKIEPGLGYRVEPAGALYLPDDESGNCPLFIKQMRHIAQSLGVEFLFTSTLQALRPEGNGIGMLIDGNLCHADAVVLATGMESGQLLKHLGINIPLYPVKGYSATAPIKNFDEAPLATVADDFYKTAIVRMGSRIRVAGIAELGARTDELHKTALHTLIKVGNDWFPNAANYNTSTFWTGTRPMLPDGPPLIGATPLRGIYINVGHGSSGWAMAAGSGKIVADIVSGEAPDINIDGLTLSRYG